MCSIDILQTWVSKNLGLSLFFSSIKVILNNRTSEKLVLFKPSYYFYWNIRLDHKEVTAGFEGNPTFRYHKTSYTLSKLL